MKKLLAILSLLGIGACSTFALKGDDITPVQKIYAMKLDYNVALDIPATYEALPRCGAVTVGACSKPEVVANIRRSIPVVRSSLDQAEAAARSGAGTALSAMIAAQGAMAEIYKIMAELAVPVETTAAGPTSAVDPVTLALAMKAVSAILVALPAVTNTYLNAKQTQAIVTQMATNGHQPTVEEWNALNASLNSKEASILSND